jgi:hypothetical protein
MGVSRPSPPSAWPTPPAARPPASVDRHGSRQGQRNQQGGKHQGHGHSQARAASPAFGVGRLQVAREHADSGQRDQDIGDRSGRQDPLPGIPVMSDPVCPSLAQFEFSAFLAGAPEVQIPQQSREHSYARMNLAVTAFEAFMVTTHGAVPEHAPAHPANADPAEGTAVSVTDVPLA